ncbi:MAG: hypothetical protein ABIH21_03450 [Patescibacteria group bacterium]
MARKPKNPLTSGVNIGTEVLSALTDPMFELGATEDDVRSLGQRPELCLHLARVALGLANANDKTAQEITRTGINAKMRLDAFHKLDQSDAEDCAARQRYIQEEQVIEAVCEAINTFSKLDPFLSQVALVRSDVAGFIATHIRDLDGLMRIINYWHGEEHGLVRLAAIRRFGAVAKGSRELQEKLAFVVHDIEETEEIRFEAFNQISDDAVQSDVVARNPDYQFTLRMMRKIRDKFQLARAMCATDSMIRCGRDHGPYICLCSRGEFWQRICRDGMRHIAFNAFHTCVAYEAVYSLRSTCDIGMPYPLLSADIEERREAVERWRSVTRCSVFVETISL